MREPGATTRRELGSAGVHTGIAAGGTDAPSRARQRTWEAGSDPARVVWTTAPLDAAGWGDALQLKSGELLAGFSVAEPRAPYGKRRIYVDTSVIGGCEEEIFREGSQRLFEDFRSGRATLVISKRTFDELEGAPEAVRAWLRTVPAENIEEFRVTKKAEDLADAYLAAGALGPAHHTDALHVALASLAGVDFLASWNLKHMVAPRRINAYNEVNRRMGYPAIDIREPPVPTDDQRATAQEVRSRSLHARSPRPD